MAHRRRSKYRNVGHWINSPMELAFFSWIRANSFYLSLGILFFLSNHSIFGIVSLPFTRRYFRPFNTLDLFWGSTFSRYDAGYVTGWRRLTAENSKEATRIAIREVSRMTCLHLLINTITGATADGKTVSVPPLQLGENGPLTFRQTGPGRLLPTLLAYDEPDEPFT